MFEKKEKIADAIWHMIFYEGLGGHPNGGEAGTILEVQS